MRDFPFFSETADIRYIQRPAPKNNEPINSDSARFVSDQQIGKSARRHAGLPCSDFRYAPEKIRPSGISFLASQIPYNDRLFT